MLLTSSMPGWAATLVSLVDTGLDVGSSGLGRWRGPGGDATRLHNKIDTSGETVGRSRTRPPAPITTDLELSDRRGAVTV